jgi:hypothetical protein
VVKGIVWTEPARTDIRRIERQTALHILKTLARYVKTGEGDTKQLQDIDPPLLACAPRITASSFATRAITWKFRAC